MLSSLNAFGGLSAANILMLFGANSSSSSPSTSTNDAKSASTGLSASSANDPANAIKAILAQAQIEQSQTGTLGGGSVSVVTAAAAYAQMGGSTSLLSASVAIASPSAAQQIADAVSQVNSIGIIAQTDVDPATHNGISSYDDAITVTAADAVNFTISNGAVTMTAPQGSALPSELPSSTSIQQAYNQIISEDQGGGIATPFNGSFTLVKLPPGASGGGGLNSTTFAADGYWGEDKWQLVLTQASVSVAVSDTQIKG